MLGGAPPLAPERSLAAIGPPPTPRMCLAKKGGGPAHLPFNARMTTDRGWGGGNQNCSNQFDGASASQRVRKREKGRKSLTFVFLAGGGWQNNNNAQRAGDAIESGREGAQHGKMGPPGHEREASCCSQI